MSSKFYLSGGSINAVSAESLGGEISLIAVSGSLFPNVTPKVTESIVQHRCIYVKNISGFDMQEVFVFIRSQTLGGSNVEIGLGGDVNEVAFLLPNEESSPPSIVFSEPSESSPIPIENMADDDFVSIWMRRTTSPGQAQRQVDDGLVLCFVSKIQEIVQ